MTALFDPDRLDAIKVQFKRSIFEDDFPDKGMVAWLVDIELDAKHECYQLFFDFAEFESHNEKYFKKVYWGEGGDRHKLRTAHEAGQYTAKYSVYFGDSNWSQNQLEEGLQKCLMVLD